MTPLPPELEALMPEPFGDIVNKYGDPHAFAERDVRYLGDMQKQAIGTALFTADQVRAAILGATERGQADTARLDWIVRQADEFSCSMIVDAPGDGEYSVHGMNGYGQGKTPREAIDNAMRFNGAAAIRGDGA